MANCSGKSFAKLFGVISPKIRTTTVMTIVETVAPILLPHSSTNTMVPIDAKVIFTTLFPIKMVESKRL